MNVSDQIELCSINVGNAGDTIRIINAALEEDRMQMVIIQNALSAVSCILDQQADQLSTLASEI